MTSDTGSGRNPAFAASPSSQSSLSGPSGLQSGVRERFYIDCEFDGHGGPLLSMAVIRENGDGIHIQTRAEPADPWVIENVMPLMSEHQAGEDWLSDTNSVGKILRAYIGDCQEPVIVADSPVDIGRFCGAISTGPDGGWASTGYPRMTFEVHNVDCYPTDLPGAVQHNAWWDAAALRHALAAGSRRAETSEDLAQCEASQSGGDSRNAQRGSE